MRSKLASGVVGVLAVAALLAVFGLYVRPEFMLTLANQVWGCF
jgi:hypothetical protein